MNRSITIAGAGPAGMTAAIVLARAGYRVRIFERNSRVGERFNDDYQGLENWSRHEDVLDEIAGMGIQPTWWQRPFSGGSLFDPALRHATIETRRPLFYLVRRGNTHPHSLDLALLAQARDAGVEIVFNTTANAAEADIMAGGPSGKPSAVAAGVTFSTDHDEYAGVILNDELAPGGYVYVLIADGQATLGTVLFSRFKEARACLRRSIEIVQRLLGITAPPDAKYWGGQGRFSIPATAVRHGALHVGEAGGFQDYLFGFGIRHAMVSAYLAAESIIHGRDYDQLWRSRLLPHLKASVAGRIVYERFDWAKRGLCLIAGKYESPESFLRWLYRFSAIHQAVYRVTGRTQAQRLGSAPRI